MPALVYFVSGRQAINAKIVRDIGLGYSVNGGVAQKHTGRGPSGGDGVYFAASGTRIREQDLEFEPIPGQDKVWLGLANDDLPGPKDLAREEQMPGHWVKMADGRKWLIPVVRLLSGDTGLPRKLEYTEDGWGAGDVVPRLKTLWDDACSFWDALAASWGEEDAEGEREVKFTGSDEADLAAVALGINYRIGPAEISRLGLFTTELKATVCLALVDWPSVKKLDEEAPPN